MTLIGWFLVPSALFWLVCRPNLLYKALIFSLPFSATVIANVGEKGIPVWLYLGTLWMARELYPEFSAMRFTYPRSLRSLRLGLFVFCLVAGCSLIMPVLLSGKISIASPNLLNPTSELLTLTSRNFTALLYLWFGSLLALLVARRNLDRSTFIATLKVYLAAILFVAAWGVLQWLMLKLGLPYPSYIFNNSSTESAQGFATFLAPEVPRISSVAVEPSILAQVLLTVLPFVVFTGVLRFPVISKQFNRSLLILIIGVLLLSTSFSAYLGSGIVMIAIVIAFYRSKTLRLRHVLLIFLTLSIILLACLTVPSVTEFVNSQLLTKSDSYSGVERVRTVILAFGYFTESPWLGLGWGSVTSHDLVINILSNVGLVGLCSFLTFVVILWRRLRVSIHNSFFAEEKCLKIAIALSLITLLLMNVFTGVSFFFGHFWLTVGLAMGATAIKYDKPKLVVENALSDEK